MYPGGRGLGGTLCACFNVYNGKKKLSYRTPPLATVSINSVRSLPANFSGSPTIQTLFHLKWFSMSSDFSLFALASHMVECTSLINGVNASSKSLTRPSTAVVRSWIFCRSWRIRLFLHTPKVRFQGIHRGCTFMN